MKSCLLIMALATVLQIAFGSPMQELDDLMKRGDNCRRAKGTFASCNLPNSCSEKKKCKDGKCGRKGCYVLCTL
ncbi:hypothetical protein BUE80_DR005910 [Diplocarpon rosae]|nr:hypothetical protein BUE80_DR005910 [Diplocarpon rosae]